MFTAEDVEKLKQIYHLVKERGMTLKGANQVIKRGKKDDAAQEMELLERLQKIRAALVEVREELKGNAGEHVFTESDEPVVEPEVKEQCVEEKKPEPVEVEVVEQPKKRVVRRKKRAEEEDKELFPFYEQSLF